MKKYCILFLPVIFIVTGCRQQTARTGEDIMDTSGITVTVSGTEFIDSHGRQVIFNGVNRVNKDPAMNYIDNDTPDTYRFLSGCGFNCIRLGIIWAGAEPEPGRYDEKYLDRIEEQVNLAGQNGIFVILDMHQDLYSVSFSDGAPAWATLTDNQPHIKGSIWSDAYFMSPAVQKAFDNFWADKSAVDGTGIQTHYIRMWKHIAGRFANNKTVIGYDIMNEPFNGSQGTQILPQVLTEYAKLYAEETGKILSGNEVMAIWADENLRFEALSRIQDSARYARVLDAATELNRQFERNTLQLFYQRAGEAIREADTTHILFLEHSYFCNTGVRTAIEPVKNKKGDYDRLVAYAAHGYDLLVDTRNYDNQSNSRVALIFNRIGQTSVNLNIPVIIGEWGAFSGNREAMVSAADFITGIFEKKLFSNTYWAYYPGIEKNLFFNSAIIRPYPSYTGGSLDNYSYDNETGKFTCTWDETPEIKAPTVIYIPDIENIDRESISLNPARSSTLIEPMKNSRAGYLIIPVTGKSMNRTIEFTIDKEQAAFSIERNAK